MPFNGNAVCNSFKGLLMAGGIDFNTDVYKLALYTNKRTLCGPAVSVYDTQGEVVAPGYPPGGVVLTINEPPTPSGSTVYMSFADVTINAALTARGAIIYKNVLPEPASAGTALFILDFGADKTSTSTFTVKFPPATPTDAILRLV